MLASLRFDREGQLVAGVLRNDSHSRGGKAQFPADGRLAAGASMTHMCYAEISRDDEAGVWYVSDTDVPGLAAEAALEPDLLLKIHELVPELYELNRHLLDQSQSQTMLLRVTSSRLEAIRLVP